MKKISPLEQADSLFKNTEILGSDFEKEKWVEEKASPKVKFKLSILLEKKTEKKVFDPFRWLDFFKERVKEIRKAAASLTGWSKRTRYKKVADKVKAVWELCQKILDVMDSSNGQRIVYYKTKKPERLLPDSVRTAAYLSFSTGLRTFGRDGFFAVKDAKKDKEKRVSDPKRWETGIQSAKAESPAVAPPKKKRSRNTKPEETGAEAKIIGAISFYHEYENGWIPNKAPIGCRKLASAAGVSPASVTRFFINKKISHKIYKVICLANPKKLAILIQNWVGETPLGRLKFD